MAQKTFHKFSAEFCEHLYAAPKRVVSTIRWRVTNAGSFVFQANVLTNDELMLDLVGYFDPDSRFRGSHWGFTLKHNGHLVRSYDMSRSHKNPGELGRIKGPHKHKYRSSRIARYAYSPDPPISTSDPDKALFDFLDECNIELLPLDYFPLGVSRG